MRGSLALLFTCLIWLFLKFIQKKTKEYGVEAKGGKAKSMTFREMINVYGDG